MRKKSQKDKAQQKIDAAVERLGLKASTSGAWGTRNKVNQKLGLKRGGLFTLGLGEFDE